MTKGPPDHAVEVSGLAKTYHTSGVRSPRPALNGIDLTIPRSSFFGLLGPNGAGKSTLINILAGLVARTSGEARIWGHDIDRDMRRARRSIGVVPQELNIDPFFTPLELLDVQAGLYGVPKDKRRGAEILEAVGLADKAKAYARTLSGGMRRRLLVAKAMVHNPPVLVLDEPTAGVDIELRRQLWDYVRNLNDRGATILLTTHYLEEAEELCDRIAIINHGDLIACESTRDLLGRLDSKELKIVTDGRPTDIPDALRGFNVTLLNDGALVFSYSPSQSRAEDIIRACGDAGLTINDVTTREADLEDIFLQLTRADNSAERAGGAAR